jgi:hypothetical protein
MQRIGHRAPWLIAGALAAAIPALWMRGFTVDDALIAVRYARHLAAGTGWRFNISGPSTDGVTPLPWPLILVPLARADALVVLGRAQTLGFAVWTIAAGALGLAVGGTPGAPVWARAGALCTMALSLPLAAHAVSGMETPIATALATAAALLASRPRLAAICAGLAASLRPEMVAWACVLAFGLAIAKRRDDVAGALLGTTVAAAPFVACAMLRLASWGRPAPLSLLAKPSDLSHGLAYAGAACLVTIAPILVLAPLALRRVPEALVIVAAFLAHGAAVVAAGGDWMPFARLMVPVVPTLVWAFVLASTRAHPAATAARLALAMSVAVFLLSRYGWSNGTRARDVGSDRAALIATARPWLKPLRRVAALDVGWVGAATEGDVMDLAGLTDPEIAVLPGGHTSKRVDAMRLVTRGADGLLLYAPEGLPRGGLEQWRTIAWRRAVEARLGSDDVIGDRFVPAAWLPLGQSGGGYVLLRGP